MTQSVLLLVVREADPELRPDPDGLLHPIPSDKSNEVVLENRDGRAISSITAKGLVVQTGTESALRTIASVDDVAIRVSITDARIAFASSKFDKGGGWIGGAAVMVLANTVSKSLAAARTRGKMLVGHVRYPWLYAVGASPKTGLLDNEEVRLCLHTSSGEALVVDMTLPSDLAASEVAAEIVRRAATHRVACRQGLEHAAEFETLRDTRAMAGAKGGYSFHLIPASQPIDESSARIGSTTSS